MRTITILLSAFLATTASAQNNRSFVATYGNDANNCTAGNECRTFARAISVTNAGGEVLALTSGGYGAFVIAKAVSVIATTGDASITTGSGVPGVEIDAGATDRVVLRGLIITDNDNTTYGIAGNTFGLLSIENCTTNGGAYGIAVSGDASSRATIIGTTARGSSSAGFLLGSTVTMTDCRAEKNSVAGVWLEYTNAANGSVATSHLVSSGNQYGVYVIAGANTGQGLTITLDHALISDNVHDGIFSSATNFGSPAQVFLTNSSVTTNGQYGLHSDQLGVIYSMKNNAVGGNVAGDANNPAATLTPQ